MKKFISLLLALIMMLSLCACGGGETTPSSTPAQDGNTTPEQDATPEVTTITKDEMLETAENLDIEVIYKAVSVNKVRAEEKYLGNTYVIKGIVKEIGNNYVDITMTGGTIRTYLPTDDIKLLSTMEWVEIVGEISVVDYYIDGNDPWSSDGMGVEMTPAYIANNIYTVEGKVSMRYRLSVGTGGSYNYHTGEKDSWELMITGSDGIEYHLEDAVPVEHVLGENIDSVIISGEEVKDGDTIAISGELFNNVDGSKRMDNITLISSSN